MPDSLADQQVRRLVETLTIDLSRFMTAGLPPRAIMQKLREVPEFDQALYLRARRQLPLPLDPSTDAEKQEIVEVLTRVADWLDDGMHEAMVAKLREVADGLRD